MKMTKVMKKFIREEKGLSLLQVLIGLLVFGLLAEGFMQGYRSWQNSRIDARMRADFEKVTMALANYVTRNGHFPCPAPMNITPNDAGFGQGASACAGGAGSVAQGALPVVDLGLPMEAMIDPFGSKLLYAVTGRYTNPATYTSGTNDHAITVTGRAFDNVPIQTQRVAFVIVSHGPDRKGAYPYNGRNVTIPCTSRPGHDVANCDGNSAFASFPRGRAAGANWFDDYITYNLVQKETTLWAITPDASQDAGLNIINRNRGNVGIGTANPTTKLNVHGGNMRVEGDSGTGNIYSTGQIDVLSGSRVQATDVEAGGNINVREEVRSNTRIRANRFCYSVDINDC